MRTNTQSHCYPYKLKLIGLALACFVVNGTALAADTDIEKYPLGTSLSKAAVKSNVMFTLDDSGSMGWSYMPDDMKETGQYGYWSSQCNGVAYNPKTTYDLPVDDKGNALPAGSLVAGTPYYYVYAGKETALNWEYDTNGVKKTNFYNECTSNIDATTSAGKGVFTKTNVSAAERQNYANWYAYYRTRMAMMKTSVSLAFKPMSDKFRIGFNTISNKTVATANKKVDDKDHSNVFLNIADFGTAQKSSFYGALDKAVPGDSTPLRGALSKVGQYFAKQRSGQTYDPIQYYCQKNFHILSTDGYWNTGSEVSDEGASGNYGPYALNNTSEVGNQDAAAARPMYDGAKVVKTETTPYTFVSHDKSVYRTRRTTTVWSQNVYSLSASGCNNNRQRVMTQEQRRTETVDDIVTNLQDRVGTYTRTVTYENGVKTADSNSSTTYGAATVTSSSTAATTTPGNWANNGNASQGNCQANPTLPSPNPSVAAVQSGPSVDNADTTPVVTQVSAEPAVAGTTTTTMSTTGGSDNSLADVAMYYYQTDLRDKSLNNCTGSAGVDVCANDVPPHGTDEAKWQHVTTFTLGLGLNGTLKFDPDYLNQTKGAYHDLKQPGGPTWPKPDGKAANIDDLWHAAVNGRGQYFSANDPDTLAASLKTILSQLDVATGSASGAAASNLQPVQGDNTLFIAQYTTVNWTGDVLAMPIDPVTGVISAPIWSAFAQLKAKVDKGEARNIFYASSKGLRTFDKTNLDADGLFAHFDAVCKKPIPLTQCSTKPELSDQLNSGANMVQWLRGQEIKGIYRTRENTADEKYGGVGPLGDIVGGAPVYVKKPPFGYKENGYPAFVSKHSSPGRAGTVFVAANDGMLHAFDGATGDERWAYIPSEVMSKMYRLADEDYASRHEYFVDGAPVIGDVFPRGAASGEWKTILVGGLGAGGRSYYALDITDPAMPIPLWEYRNKNLGLSFGNPIITKRMDGRWVVVFTSGYNNNVDGDGNGHLFVLDAYTGEELLDISTPNGGNTGTPSGLAKLNVWVESNTNNIGLRYYAGDVLGNLWRFDIDGLIEPKGQALLLAQLQVGGVAQPITTQPQLAEVDKEHKVVYVATGKLLGTSDLSNTDQQSVYAIKDSLKNTSPVNRSSLVKQTMTEDTLTKTRKIANPKKVDWSSPDVNGWYVDLITKGERVNVDPQLLFNTLTVAANIPSVPNTDKCKPVGASYLYNFDIGSGGSAVKGSDVVGNWLDNTVIVGLSFVQLKTKDGEAGSGDTLTITVDNDGKTKTRKVPEPSVTGGTTKRTSWREIVN
jgi:type IV pilus assembly protein PilY1